MKFNAVRQERLYLKVADQLSSYIASGGLAVGDRLPSERDLAKQFGVGRPTIREAMIALELAGSVEIRSGSGVYVRDAGSSGVAADDDVPGPLELLEARVSIEGEAAALAAERASEEDIEAIQRAYQEMQRENAEGGRHEAADESFHLQVARASGNSAIYATVAQLWRWRQTSVISVFLHERLRSRGVKPVLRDHLAIVEALWERNPQRARQAMRDHLQGVIDAIVADDDSSPAPDLKPLDPGK